jgi:hypothetical protein
MKHPFLAKKYLIKNEKLLSKFDWVNSIPDIWMYVFVYKPVFSEKSNTNRLLFCNKQLNYWFVFYLTNLTVNFTLEKRSA